MDRSNIDKIARTPEDRVLLAKLWDKIQSGVRRNIPVSTCFLSLRELDMTKYLFGSLPGLYTYGGYEEAERKMLVYLPDYLEEGALPEEAGLVCLRAEFYEGDTPSHRDFLGALMGVGIARETVGDICVGKGSCDFFVSEEIATYVEQNLLGAGRTKLRLQRIAAADVQVPQPEFKTVRDTVSSLRLDSILAAGFRIGRNQAGQYITTGRVAMDGLPCEKPDKAVAEGCKISVRGLGKIKLETVGGQSKKDRIWVIIQRYV